MVIDARTDTKQFFHKTHYESAVRQIIDMVKRYDDLIVTYAAIAHHETQKFCQVDALLWFADWFCLEQRIDFKPPFCIPPVLPSLFTVLLVDWNATVLRDDCPCAFLASGSGVGIPIAYEKSLGKRYMHLLTEGMHARELHWEFLLSPITHRTL